MRDDTRDPELAIDWEFEQRPRVGVVERVELFREFVGSILGT